MKQVIMANGKNKIVGKKNIITKCLFLTLLLMCVTGCCTFGGFTMKTNANFYKTEETYEVTAVGTNVTIGFTIKNPDQGMSMIYKRVQAGENKYESECVNLPDQAEYTYTTVYRITGDNTTIQVELYNKKNCKEHRATYESATINIKKTGGGDGLVKCQENSNYYCVSNYKNANLIGKQGDKLCLGYMLAYLNAIVNGYTRGVDVNPANGSVNYSDYNTSSLNMNSADAVLLYARDQILDGKPVGTVREGTNNAKTHYYVFAGVKNNITKSSTNLKMSDFFVVDPAGLKYTVANSSYVPILHPIAGYYKIYYAK